MNGMAYTFRECLTEWGSLLSSLLGLLVKAQCPFCVPNLLKCQQPGMDLGWRCLRYCIGQEEKRSGSCYYRKQTQTTKGRVIGEAVLQIPKPFEVSKNCIKNLPLFLDHITMANPSLSLLGIHSKYSKHIVFAVIGMSSYKVPIFVSGK